MDVVVLAVQLNELRRKIKADFRKDGTQSFASISFKDPLSNLGDEDQMNMQLKDAMSTMSNFT
jgi:hypothetical protein